MAKSFEENVKIVTAPKHKLWIKTQAKLDAVRALSLSRKEAAVEPLLFALKTPALREAALEGLERLQLKSAGSGTVRALMLHKKDLIKSYYEEYFNEDRNANLKRLSMDMTKAAMVSSPEDFLGAALSMLKQISWENAEGIADCEREGLAPYSRDRFMENIRILDRNGVMFMWPELERIDEEILRIELLISRYTGKGAATARPAEAAPAAVSAEAGLPEDLGIQQNAMSSHELKDFAEDGLLTKTEKAFPMTVVPRLIEQIYLTVAEKYPHVEPVEARRMLASALVLNCHRCGTLSAQYVQQMLRLVDYAQDKGVSIDSLDQSKLGAGSFATGHGPDCRGSAVEVVFDLSYMKTAAESIQAERQAIEEKETAGDRRYNVLFSGEIGSGHSTEQVKERLARVFRVDVSRVQGFFTGKPVAVKKNVDFDTAKKFMDAFEQAGALAKMEVAEE